MGTMDEHARIAECQPGQPPRSAVERGSPSRHPVTPLLGNPDRRHLIAGIAAGIAAPAIGAARPIPRAEWRQLSTDPYPGKQDDIAFVSPTTGWYGNGKGKVYGTTDGGDSWTLLWERPGTFVRSLGFIDEQRGFLGNVGTNYYPGVSDPHPLYLTTDGGRSWSPVAAPGIEDVAGICGIDILPVRRLFQGGTRTAHVVHAAGRVGGPARVMRSEDDGESWRVIDLSPLAGMILDVKFHTPAVGFVAAAAPSGSGDGEARILRTLDGGRNWAAVYRSGRPKENVWKMSWPSARVGYGTVQSYDDTAGNVRRVVVKSSDGGATWRELPLDSGKGIQEFGIGFADERHGWIGARDHGYETLDGGRSWSPASLGQAVNKIRIVRGGGVTRAFAIGRNVYRANL